MIYYKYYWFFDLCFIINTASFLKIEEHIQLMIQQYVERLKEAKEEYLYHKSQQQSHRDEYVAELGTKVALAKRNNERLKQYWQILSRYFGKPKAKAISEVEYSVEGSVIRVLSQIKVE